MKKEIMSCKSHKKEENNMKLYLLAMVVCILGIFNSNSFAEDIPATGTTTTKGLDGTRWIGISVCNMTYRKPVEVILRSTDRHSWDFFFGKTDNLWKNPSNQDDNWWHSGAAITPFDCQVGIHDNGQAFIPYASFEDSNTWKNIGSATGSQQMVSGWSYRNHWGGTLWLVPNIRHAIPSYDTRAPKFLFIPVASDEVMGNLGITNPTAKDYIDNSSCKQCHGCGHCLIGDNHVPGLRGPTISQYTVTKDNPKNNGFKTSRWHILSEGQNDTLGILNSYFNYVFLDTVNNQSPVTYYIATTDAAVNDIVSYLESLPADSKKSILAEWLYNPTNSSIKIGDKGPFNLRIYAKGSNSADDFNKDDWMTIFPSTLWNHRVTPAALNVLSDVDHSICLDKTKTDESSKEKCWNNQTIILFPTTIGQKDESVILIGRTAGPDFNLMAYTYYTYNKGNTVKVNSQLKDSQVNALQLDNDLRVATNGRLLITIAPAPLTGKNPDNTTYSIPCPYVSRFDALPGIYLSNNADIIDFDVNKPETSGSTGFGSTVGMQGFHVQGGGIGLNIQTTGGNYSSHQGKPKATSKKIITTTIAK